jgi:hypothetical protein
MLKIHSFEGNNDLPDFKTPFVEVVYSYEGDFEPSPVLNLTQSKLTCEIVSKPKWNEKFKDETILKKWIQEASSTFTREMIDYTTDELNYYLKKSATNKPLLVSPIYSVYQSDDLIPTELSILFKKNASKLEKIPENQLDWHPGSKNQVTL